MQQQQRHEVSQQQLPPFRQVFGEYLTQARANPSSVTAGAIPKQARMPTHQHLPIASQTASRPSSCSPLHSGAAVHSTALDSLRYAPAAPASSHTTPGYFILRPSQGDTGQQLLVAASSTSYSQALADFRQYHMDERYKDNSDSDDWSEHSEDIGKSPEEVMANRQRRAFESKHVFACPHARCEKAYTMASNLRRHIRTTHTNPLQSCRTRRTRE
ncbi:hypothetical protein BKA62DRAFT_833230 [Auriculariales sp. MPI-PUGE-AT-0066]|nr:hypothetical protein BKA62DRAFT_833230 [Auriculariales sp. MPI-PUGE-AT-0066]